MRIDTRIYAAAFMFALFVLAVLGIVDRLREPRGVVRKVKDYWCGDCGLEMYSDTEAAWHEKENPGHLTYSTDKLDLSEL